MAQAGRINKEFSSLKASKEFEVWMVGGSTTHWKAIAAGAVDTPYQGGKFQIDIKIPEKYPYVPPKMQFDTKIWHPNVSSQTGAICLDVLKDQWTPALSIRTALLSIQVLMGIPEPDSPQDAVVASQYKDNIELFKKTAAEWTKLYATVDKVRADKIAKLTSMGFTNEQATIALEKAGWDEEVAIQTLI